MRTQQELENRSTVDRDRSARRHRTLRVVAVLAYWTWVGSASAGPAVIAAPRIEAFSAPSRDASVVSELGHGAPVCVLDVTNYPGVLLHRMGWLAIRLPGGVGYVPIEAVDLAAAPEVPDCDASVTTPAPAPASVQARDPQRPPRPRAIALAAVPPPSVRPGEPASDRPALIAGGVLPLRPARFLIGLGSGLARISKESSAQHHIGDQSATFNGTLGFTIYDMFMASAAFSLAFPSDRASFSEEVVPAVGGGDPHSADSRLSVVSYSMAVGVRTPFWALGPTNRGWVAAALFAEYGTAGMHGGRSIPNCGDCRSDDLDLSGGTFWQAGIDLVAPTRRPTVYWGLTLAYQRYAASAAFADEVRVGLGLWL